MSDIQNLTAWFKAQIGTAEQPLGSNNVIYNTHYYGHAVSGDAYPWCCSFIWDGFRQCGVPKLFCDGAQTAYCPYVVNHAKAHNQWVTSGYREGDLLLYDWDKDGVADHIGYCAGIKGGDVYSIEGNLSDRVQMVTRYHGSVMGAYRPAYSEKTEEKAKPNKAANNSAPVLPTLKKGDKGDVVRAAQFLLIGRGYTVGGTGADGDFGPATHAGTVNFQTAVGLAGDGIIGPSTWAALLGVRD